MKAHKGNVLETARILRISRLTVYKAIRKNEAGDLNDKAKAPRRVHNNTSAEIEARTLTLREELEALDGMLISEHTIRNILRRNKAKTKLKAHKPN
ncbi:MAG: hypothetical protein WA116_02265 [Anaerolineaceae bacterium]